MKWVITGRYVLATKFGTEIVRAPDPDLIKIYLRKYGKEGDLVEVREGKIDVWKLEEYLAEADKS